MPEDWSKWMARHNWDLSDVPDQDSLDELLQMAWREGYVQGHETGGGRFAVDDQADKDDDYGGGGGRADSGYVPGFEAWYGAAQRQGELVEGLS